MSFKAKPYLAALFFILVAIDCLTVQPVLAAEKLTLGGSGNALGSMRLLGSAFEKSHPGITIVIPPSLGSSGGINAVSKGAIDIGLSGRQLTDAEQKLELDIVEYARSPLVFVVKSDNPLPALSKEDYIAMLNGKTIVGSNGLRARPILRPLLDAEVLLIGSVFPDIAGAIGQATSSRKDVTIALSAQETADLIEKIPGAIGFSTLNLIRSENRQMKVLPFNGVAPSAANITNGSYPLVMGFYLVTKRNPPERVREFIKFVRSESGKRLLEESGNFDIKQRR